jgi:hypothetical protein
MNTATLHRMVELVYTLMNRQQEPDYRSVIARIQFDDVRAGIVTGPLQVIEDRYSTSWTCCHPLYPSTERSLARSGKSAGRKSTRPVASPFPC